jgi:hypothetical protein
MNTIIFVIIYYYFNFTQEESLCEYPKAWMSVLEFCSGMALTLSQDKDLRC